MASYADRKGIAIISTVQGAFNIIVRESRVGRLDLLTDIKNMSEYCGVTRDEWVESITGKDLLRINDALDRWGKAVNKAVKDNKFKTLVLVKICLMAVDDLMAITTNKKKLAKLKPIYDMTVLVDGYFDSEGQAFLSFEESNKVLNLLYGELRK